MIIGMSSPIASSFAAFATSSEHILVNVSSVVNFAFSAFVASGLNFTSLHTRLGTLKSLGILGSERT
mgnify:CR=1 FL=1